MKELAIGFFKMLVSLFGFTGKVQDRKTAEIPMKEIEHAEETQIRKVINASIEKEKRKKLIKAHEELIKFENKKGLEVVIDENGEYQVLVKKVEDLLPEDEKKSFRERRAEKGKLIGRFKDKRK